jgi:isocitrate dehydrogenase
VGQPRRVLCAGRKLQVPRRGTKGNDKARILGEAVEAATQGYLDNDNSPQRKAGQPDNRNSHYWFARYWAEALAAQTEDAELAAHFAPIAKAMADQEDQIIAELMADRGKSGGSGRLLSPR